MTREIESRPLSGAAGLGLFFVLLLGSIVVLLPGTPIEPVGLRVVLIAVGFLLTAFTINGFFIVQPGQAELLVLLGNYRGTVRTSGWWWVNPLMTKRKISLRVRSLNGDKIKVNDKDGNPVEIAAVIMWRVHDSAQATFDVDQYEQFVAVQTRDGRAAPREPVPVRHARRVLDLAARQHGRGRGGPAQGTIRSASTRPAWR